MNDSPNRDVEVFTKALELPLAERSAFLDRECDGDRDMRHRIEELLRVHGRVGDFLEPLVGETPLGPKTGPEIGEKPGDTIGKYKLLQVIGEGGCGMVFMAEQSEPIRRRVALKIIKPGMDTKCVIARFEAERQALAMMDHPNIAKVLDAGATESGRPYFVMELIRGVKITEYCDQNALTTGERLKLFIPICEAIQHAHQKGIIHRDIKPANVLVTKTVQGTAHPIVIDFGIAKATNNQQLTDKTFFTAFEMLIGTPAYMSPEQAAMTNADADTRTDIYSLGVLLYELLTSTTPFDSGDLLKAGWDEVRRVIRNEDPVRPSTRLSKMTGADLTTVARSRQADPPKLIRAVRGDLDWIVMKALEKDRTRRYQTANGLAMDIQRYLCNETVLARPPSTLYKLQKTLVRNKLLFVGIGIIMLLLVTGLVVVTAALARERRARQQAEIETAKSRQVTRFLEDTLQGAGPSVALGRDSTMLREILDRTAGQVGLEMTNQPAVEAHLRSLIGRIYLEIGDYDQAERMHRAALRLCQRVYGPESAETAAALNDLGLTLAREQKWAEAETVDRQALELRRRILGNEHPDVATSLSHLGEMYTQEGKVAEAEALVREALKIRENSFGETNLETANSLRSLCIILGDEGRWQEAEAMARQVLAIRQKLMNPEDPLIATTLTDIAWAAGAQGKLEEAGSLEQQALAIRTRVLSPNHPDVAKALYLVGERLREEGRLDAARSNLVQALALQQKIMGADYPGALDTMHSLALIDETDGKWTEAEDLHRDAYNLWCKRGEANIPQARTEFNSLLHVLMAQKKFAAAEQLLDEVLPPASTNQPPDPALLDLRLDLEGRLGHWQPAADDAGRILKAQPYSSSHYALLGALLLKVGDIPAYDRFCRGLLATHLDTTNPFVADAVAKTCLFHPASDLDISAVSHLADIAVTHGAGDEGAMPFFQICKALSEYRQEHYSTAITYAQRTIENPRRDAHPHAYGILALAYWQLGNKEKAREMLAKGEALAPATMPASMTTDPGNAWEAWLFARIQLDEAEKWIQPGP